MTAPDHALHRFKVLLASKGASIHAVWNRGKTALSLWRPPIEARHLGGDAHLVDESQPRRIETELASGPVLSSLQDVGPILLAHVGGLLRVSL
ncbi:hypothetical protein [Methylocapsa aurea]|uniref:hypothetical protein n=1 Tax=Methylocapsa aurea TaxID=663610 RepID=UPI000564C491